MKRASSIQQRLLMVTGFLILLAMSSCCPCKRLASSTETYNQDSSSYVEKLVPVLARIPGDSTSLHVKLIIDPATGKPEAQEYEARGKRSSIKLNVDQQGNVKADCNCDDYKAEILAKEKEISRIKNQKQVVTQVKEVRYTAWYDKWARWIAIAAIIFITYKTVKFFRP